MSGSKAPLACVWYEEVNDFILLLCRGTDGAGELADGKPWVSMSLNWNEFTIPTRVTFLAFGFPTNVRLTLLIIWLLALYARSVL